MFARLRTRVPAVSVNRAIGQSGQAVLEYILILLVTVAILLGVLYQFSDAFKKYVASYFGNYVACLLETGEMPSLGGESGASASVCGSHFEPFTISNGRPLNGKGVGARSNAGARVGRTASNTRSRSAGSRGFTSDSGPTTNGENFRRGSKTRYSTSAPSSGRQTGTKPYAGEREEDGVRAQQMISVGRSRLTNRFNLRDDKKSEKGGFFTQKKITARGGSQITNRKLAFDATKLNTKRSVASGDLSLELSVGDYIRYLIIFGIIAAIFIFFGGQIAQLRKSWEKD